MVESEFLRLDWCRYQEKAIASQYLVSSARFLRYTTELQSLQPSLDLGVNNHKSSLFPDSPSSDGTPDEKSTTSSKNISSIKKMSKTRSYAQILIGSRLFLTAMAIHLSLRVAPLDLQQGGNSRIP
ncbi:putative cytochrome c biosynthesis ccmC-like mitochondrial protein [Capsicum baccatum]|uniref:Cytochrome c biosynthesis ccmC-like mitochondrial protein n=1 Tax=Capsicum baccatum TaxID=33114 RepID=A0A2G2WTC6_CAPBA|nr:putative cytochrome c biosynthesis ccmC-like mitochondrial protein [Capsicum baccatum]